VAAAFIGSVSQAQVVIAPPPTVGSSNPVSAEPLVSRPGTTPCTVALFTNMEFNDYNERTFTYTPPTACPGPWAKVVFTADLTVTKGVQYDRSAQIYLNNVTIYRGTTAEPGTNFSPSWHVERDVTDLSATFYTAASGIANIQNIVNSTYTGIIYGNAALVFYPASTAYPAPTVPDMVIPIYQTDPSYYHETSAPLTDSVTLPKNTQSLYLDVTAQTDEFWWLSTPNATVAPLVNDVDATAFREIDVSIDGTPAGIAPNHPYVFTGGIDPDLWIPVPQAQTLNLKPYRINLTPFAGKLDDGNAHTFVLNDVNTQVSSSGGSLVNGNLLVYEDHGSTTVTGAVTSNTLTAAPATTVTSSVNLDSNLNGSAVVSEALNRSFTITGNVTTSQGLITTTVTETVDWSNLQNVLSSDTDLLLEDLLTSTVDAVTTTTTTAGTTSVENYTSNPLKMSLGLNINPDTGAEAEATTLELNDLYKTNGPGTYTSQAQEDVISTDTLNFDANGNFTGNDGMASTGTYISSDSNGNNYASTLTAAGNVLTGVTSSTVSDAVTVFVSTSNSSAVQGTAVTLSAKVSPQNSTNVPTGYVTFYVGASPATVLGTVAVTSTGASLTVTTLPVGTDVITATYTGDTNFVSASGFNSVSVAVTAAPTTFTLGAVAPASITLVQGQSGVLAMPVNASGAFSGTVTLACTGMPAETSCTINPAAVTLVASQSTTVSIVVATTAPNNTYEARDRMPRSRTLGGVAGGVAFAGLCLLLLPVRRSRRFRSLTMVLLAVLGLGAAGSLTGCIDGNNTTTSSGTYLYSGTPTGTYTFTVTGTSGTTTQMATFSVTVTQ
jgi:hypothetical protein